VAGLALGVDEGSLHRRLGLRGCAAKEAEEVVEALRPTAWKAVGIELVLAEVEAVRRRLGALEGAGDVQHPPRTREQLCVVAAEAVH